MSKFSLANRKCLVTGGTRGIGRAIVNELVDLGAEVFICARSKDDVETTVNDLTQAGHKAQGCTADLSDAQQRQQLLQKALQLAWACADDNSIKYIRFVTQVSDAFEGQLHVLVCNAGTNTQLPTLNYSQEDYDRIVGTNLESTFALCQLMQPLLAAGAAASNSSQQATAPAAAAQATSKTEGSSDSAASQASSTTVSPASRSSKGDACIIFISSVAGGPLAGRSGSLYAVSKAGLNQLAASLACEWASAGIRVNSVAPWVTLTELGKQNLKDPALVDRLLSRTPLGRLAQPEDISGLVAFLASPAATFITGQTIAVDGGYSVMGFW